MRPGEAGSAAFWNQAPHCGESKTYVLQSVFHWGW